MVFELTEGRPSDSDGFPNIRVAAGGSRSAEASLSGSAMMGPERDLKAQGAVLDLLLYECDSPRTVSELEAALRDEVILVDEGAIRWAVEDLVGVGLLEFDADRVRLTAAAVHFDLARSV
jgi:hypothetical protein